MSVSIIQSGSLLNLSQSPIPITLEESSSVVLNSGYQYVLNLYYWTGSNTDSGSEPNYTLVKYPNNSGVGIFDVSRILNSNLQQLVQQNPSQVGYFAVEGYDEWISGTTYVSGSHVRSNTMKYIDGYSIFQESIAQPVYDKTPHWPLMTDGPVTQSAFDFNWGTMSVYTGTTGASTPTKVRYTTNEGATAEIAVSSSLNTSNQIQQVPIGPASIGLPSTTEWYNIQAISESIPLGTPIRFNVTCNQKYPNIRIKWKNRYGQFDIFNFNMVNRQSFSVNRSVYNPQIGSWEGRGLSYQNYDSSTLNYLVDANQSISVNTDWVPETYNDIFKQLLVSDEIYWIYDEPNDLLRPITIATNSLTFKTGVNDHVIQYGFDFNFGQQYKLII